MKCKVCQTTMEDIHEHLYWCRSCGTMLSILFYDTTREKDYWDIPKSVEKNKTFSESLKHKTDSIIKKLNNLVYNSTL